jgi:hypothetical protein
MSDHEFNQLLSGPLSHPLPMMMLNRLATALRVVVEKTGDAGAKALREHCDTREEKDQRDQQSFDA